MQMGGWGYGRATNRIWPAAQPLKTSWAWFETSDDTSLGINSSSSPIFCRRKPPEHFIRFFQVFQMTTACAAVAVLLQVPEHKSEAVVTISIVAPISPVLPMSLAFQFPWKIPSCIGKLRVWRNPFSTGPAQLWSASFSLSDWDQAACSVP